MNRKSIIQKFQKLNVWKRNEERAPHKPLLVLYAIGKLLHGEDKLRYVEIEKDLRDLLREFGPWRSAYRPQDPFWRLRNDKDKVWEIPNEHKIGEIIRSNGISTGDAKIEELRRYGVGNFLKPIADQLEKRPKLAFEIAKNLLDAHFTPSYHDDLLQAVGIEFPTQVLYSHPRDPKFRENVLRAYEYKCAVCSFDVSFRNLPVALEAAHIKWHRANGPATESNGLALCSLHHKLFDRGVFRLSLQCDILVSDDARGHVGFQEWLMRYHGEKINFPQRQSYYPDKEYIQWHAKWVFKGNHREL